MRHTAHEVTAMLMMWI